MVICGLLSKFRRRNLWKKYSSDMKSYKSACQEDPKLKSFDSELYQQTNEIIKSLAAQAETHSLSQSSFIDVYGFQLKLSQYAVKLITDSEEDVRENKDLRSLVDVYFKSTAKTLQFFNNIENCVKKAEIRQRIIQLAEKHFERESANREVGANEKKYERTLEELNKFKATGDPFDDAYMTQYKSVYEEQELLLKELHKQRVKLDKKLRNVKMWRTFSNVVFVTAYISVLVLSVAAAAITSPPVAIAVAGVLAAPIDYAGKWCNKMLKEYEKALERRIDLVSNVEIRAKVNNEAMMEIGLQVDKLIKKMSEIEETVVDFAVDRTGDAEAMKTAMQGIKKKVDGFTEKIKEVRENAARCSKLINFGRYQVLGRILNLPPTSVS